MDTKQLPGFSMVMTCYNQHNFIQEAVRSALSMKYDGPMELIIVDDASTDDSVELIEKTIAESSSHLEVKIVRLAENKGVAGATDAGYAAAKYEWVILLDGDDVQCPDRLQKTAELIRDYPDVVMIMLSARQMDSHGNLWGYMSYGFFDYNVAPQELYLHTPQERVLNQCADAGRISAYGCAMATRTCLLRGKWKKLVAEDNHQRFAQDPPLQTRSVLSGPILGSREIACHYRSHAGNILNRERVWDYNGYCEHELFMTRYAAFELATELENLRAIERAEKEEGLSDFSPEQLLQYKECVNRRIAACRLRSHWWSVSWIRRLVRIFKYQRAVSPNFKRWAFPRLLPFRLFCRLKFNKHTASK